MAKPLQQDSEGNIINDLETVRAQKGAAAYEAENAMKQAAMEAKDKATQDKYMSLLRTGMDMLGRKKYDPEENRAIINIGRGMTEGAEELRKKPKGMKKGGAVKASSASKRGDGCAIRGKTKGRMV